MIPKKSSYFVTGAGGFIGSSICRKLLESEHAFVIGIDNFSPYYSVSIKRDRIHRLKKNHNFIFFKSSILNEQKMKLLAQLYKPSILIHTAAMVGVRSGEDQQYHYYETNIMGTQILLNSFIKHLKHAVIFSSSSVYGNHTLPFRESQKITMDIPLSTYGASKAAMEYVVHNLYRVYQKPITIVRPFSIYGPDGRPDMLPMKILLHASRKLPLHLFGNNEIRRDWTYIDDLVAAVEHIVVRPQNFSIVNVGSGKPIGLLDFISMANRILKDYNLSVTTITEHPRAIESPATEADISKLIRGYGYKPLVSLQEGFHHLCEYFVTHKVSYESS